MTISSSLPAEKNELFLKNSDGSFYELKSRSMEGWDIDWQFFIDDIRKNCFGVYQSEVPSENYGQIDETTQELINLFHVAVEKKDMKYADEIIEIIVKNNSNYLLDALSLYNELGRLDFALHNAIKDKNLFSSIILAHYKKDINTKRDGHEVVWLALASGCPRPYKTPIELALEVNMVELIPYLLMKNANLYNMRSIGFLLEGEENLDYLKELDYKSERRVCVKTKKVFFPVSMNRTFIGDLIARNRLDIIEILQKTSIIDWNKACCNAMNIYFSPLQFALVIKRFEIAQFLIDHGAKIE